jgi:hypothetical protein
MVVHYGCPLCKVINTPIHLTLIPLEDDDLGYWSEELLNWSHNILTKVMIMERGGLDILK